MKRFGIIVLFLTLFTSISVNAQSGFGERIASYDTKVIMTSDNTAKITEEIVYDYGTNYRHGIERFIPLRTIAGDTGKYYYYDIEWGEITQDGAKAEILIEDDADRAYVRIGDPDVEISGVHSYKINYTLSPLASKDTDGDFINLNIVGNEWSVPINFVSASITLENNAKVLSVRCYSGSTGSIDQECSAANDGSLARFSAENLAPAEGLTANILVEAGKFTVYQSPQDPPPPDLRPFIGLGIGIVGLGLGGVLRAISWAKYRARKKDQTIVPQYEPPKDLSVGEIGLLYDNSTDMKEITATLIDLAVKGYIKITQTRQKSLFKKAEYQFDLLKDKKHLAEHEQTLIDLIFKGDSKTAKLADVDKTTAGSKIQKVKDSFENDLESKGFRLQNKALSSQKSINKIYGFAALVIVIYATVLGIISISSNLEFGVVIWTSLFGLFLLLMGAVVSTRIEISDTGYSKWAEIQGLILYLTVAEKDRLAFHDAPEKNPELFSALLPAAIALGVDKNWAQQFKDMDVAESVNWYSGNGNFSSVLLASSLSNDFGGVVASSFTAPTQSSSGFSGGGFSGGGGGGGGGGSW